MDDSRTIRELRAADLPFIYATWLRSLYYGNPMYKQIVKDLFFNKYKLVLYELVSRSNVQVCCLTDDPDTILGYSVHEGDRLHWVYVKEPWRKLGLAKALVPVNVNSFSHITTIGKKLKPSTWGFDPFL